MISIIKKILRLNFGLIKSEIKRNKINPKTGLSETTIHQILKTPDFSVGSAKFFTKEIEYTHGPSFIHSVNEIFLEETYLFRSTTNHPYILDCGANIGLSVIYFNRLYPNAEIIAFEPDEGIFKSLYKNIKNYAPTAKIRLEKKAVWTEDTILKFYSEGALAGSSLVDFSNKKNVTTVQAVDLKKYLNRKVDFLKLDIEGAENTVIFDIKDYLNNVEHLFLEYHGVLGVTQNLNQVLALLTEKGFEYYIRLAGETMKNPFLKEQTGPFNQQLNIFCYRS